MKISEIIRRMADNPMDELYSIPCTVKDYNDADKTCTCSPLTGDADLIEVRTMGVPGNGLSYVPKIGSVVIVAMMNGQAGYIAMWSDLDSIKMLDGSYGGLTKTQELKTQLDKVNNQLQAIVTAMTNWVVVPSDGGGALKTLFTAQIAGKPAGTFTGIENDKITHGNI